MTLPDCDKISDSDQWVRSRMRIIYNQREFLEQRERLGEPREIRGSQIMAKESQNSGGEESQRGQRAQTEIQNHPFFPKTKWEGEK